MRMMTAVALAAACTIAGSGQARGQAASPSPLPAPSVAATAAAGGLTTAEMAAIDAIGRRSVDLRAAPSVQIAVLRDGAFVYRKSFGLRNVEDSVPPDAQTRYSIGSNTKQFTAASILMLQDQGKLDVDAPLATYLPEIPHAREVRIRNLLSHTGGYAEFTAREDFDMVGARPATAAEVVAAAVRRPLDFKPGTRRNYSNTGYVLLQMVIERLSGQSYADFVRSHIFVPLGMTGSYVRVYDDTFADVATEYQNFSLGPWEHAQHLEYTWFGGAGAIVSNTEDMAKWNAALDGGKLLSARSEREMMTPKRVDKNFPDYGFGIMISKLPNGHRMISHGGNTYGSATQDARFPDDRLQIMVFANSGTYEYNDAVTAIYAALVPSASATPGPGGRPKASPPPPKQPAAVLAAAKQGEAWLDAAVRGHVDMAMLRPDFRARLSAQHRAALEALAALGPRRYTLVDTDRRAPATSYLFLVQTPKAQLLYAFARDDDGKIAAADVIRHLTFEPTPAATAPAAPASPVP